MGKSRFLATGSWVALCAVASLAVAGGASAETAAAGGGTTVSGVDVNGEVVTTASAVVPLTATYSEGTIPTETLRSLSPGATTTIQTLLNSQPSIIAYTDGPLGSRSNVYFRAFNSGQFSETYAGVALNDVFNAGVTGQASVIDNTLLLPSNIDSVEIFRGVNNPAVNSYNSLGGTINYLPRRPTATFGGEVGGSYGSFDTKEFHLIVNTGDFHGLRQVISLSHADSDGWARNTGTRNTNLYYSATYAPTATSELSAIFIYNHNNSYTPFNMPVPLLEQNANYFQWPLNWTYEKDKDTSYLGIFDYKFQIAPNVILDTKFFGGNNDYRRTSYSNPLYQQSAAQPYNLENNPSGFPFWLFYPNGPNYDPVAAFGSAQAGTDYHFYGYAAWGLGVAPSLTIALPHDTLTIGGNVTYGKLHSREYWYGAFDMPLTQGYNNAWDERDERLLFSGYVQDEIRLFDDRLSLTPGVKYIYADTRDHDAIGFFYPIAGTVQDTEDYVSPTIGANFKVTENLAVYAAFGQNIKFPDISAYYGAFQNDANGNPVIVPPQVKPEYVDDYEAGVRYQRGPLAASVNLYREDFSNTFINKFDPSSQTSKVVNGGTSRYQGVEVQVIADFKALVPGDLNLYVNYAHNEATFTSSFSSDYAGSVNAGDKLANVPQDLVSAGGAWRVEGWRVNVDGRYIGKQFIDQQNSGLPTQSTIAAHFLLDVGVSKTIELNHMMMAKSVRFSINADNLLDKYYFNEAFTDTDITGASFIRAVPGAPRSVVGAIEVAF